MKFHILVFGCQMNYADSARIKAVLTNCWFSYTEHIKDADIIIFDTCSVRQKSEDKITGKLRTIRPEQKVRITGCMIQHTMRTGKLKAEGMNLKKGNFMWAIKTKKPKVLWVSADEVNRLTTGDKMQEIVGINNAFNPLFHKLHDTYPNIELMRRIDDTGFLPLMIRKIWYKITYDHEITNEYEKIIPEDMITSMNNHKTTAYIPISTWCNQFCTYCIVPYARGLEKYFPVSQIVEEAKTHLKNGAQEIVLLGQIVNKHPDFVNILKEIVKLKWLKRLRYTSPYPTYYSKELLALHEKEKKLCPHIHMPLQSGSDQILKKMFRGYTVAQAKEFIDNIRELKRDISITTDIIVGFPKETEEDFQQTLDLVRYGNFDMIYIGIYSPRPGTLAAKSYPDDIPRKIKRDRRNRLNDLLTDISLKNNKREIWNSRDVLINSITSSKAGKWDYVNTPSCKHFIIEWYTDNMKQIIIEPKIWNVKHKDKMEIGKFVNVKITEWVSFKLYGKITD